VPFDDDAEADFFRFSPPPHPDDRLWRHPSELGPGRGPGAGARDRQTGVPWGVVAAAGTAGAVLAGAGVLAFGLGERTVDRPVVERVALDTVSSTPRTDDQATDGIRQQVAPAVVAIESGGSGVVVRDDGIVLTSASLVDGAGPLTVRLPDGSSTEAKIVGSDPSTGIAVLDLDGHGYRTGVLATEAGLVQGETSFTVSVGTAGATTVAALVGATRRYHTAAGVTLDAVVGTTGDAPAHALGGPLVDTRGVVVGIVTGVDEGSASYVVPVEVARKVSEDLVAAGRVERCWLGIEGSDAGDPDVTGGGVQIASVVPDSPADRGGLRPGDVLVEIDGRMIGHLPDLMLILRSRSPGDRIDATVVRDDNPTTLAVTLGEQQGHDA
jgi:putative serine protease PepD